MLINQNTIYGVATRCGFKVVQFSDHSDFYSSWSVALQKDGRSYMVEHEGRDGWLMLYRENTPGKFEEIDKKVSHGMTDYEKISQCEAWLLIAG